MNINIYPILICPLLIGKESTTFYLPQKEVIVSAPGKIIKEIVPLCDGTHSMKNLVIYLSECWDNSSVEDLLKNLVEMGVVINARDVSSYMWQFIKNPTAWKPDLSMKSLFNHMLYNPIHPQDNEVEYVERVKETDWIELLQKRKSVRSFGGGAISSESLMRLLWSGYGSLNTSIDVDGKQLHRRTVPSAGALFQLVLHVCIFKKIGAIESGVYRVITNTPLTVELVRISDVEEVKGCFVSTELLDTAVGCMFISGDIHRSALKYGNRAMLYTALEAGHMAQNMHLCAQQEGVDSIEIGGFFEDKSAALLQIPSNIQPVISIVFGSASVEGNRSKEKVKILKMTDIVRNTVVEDPSNHGLSLPYSMVFAEAMTTQTGEVWWSCGRDKNPALAEIKSHAEACEWYLCGKPPRRKLVEKSFSQLGDNAVDPRSMLAYLPDQIGEGKKVQVFDENQTCEWITATSRVTGEKKQILADFAFFPYTPKFGRRYAFANSSGAAAQVDIEHAVEHAVLETVEREAFMITWLNKLKRCPLKEKSLPRDIRKRLKDLKNLGFKVSLVDITYDITPVIMVVVSYKAEPFLSVSTASGYSVKTIIDRALMEAEASVYCRLRDGGSRKILTSEEVVSTMDHGGYYENTRRIKRALFLFGDNRKKTTMKEMEKRNHVHSQDDLYSVIKSLEMDIYWSDLKELWQNTDIPYEVVRVFIPGMIPISFGYGIEPLGLERVRSLPVKVGLLFKKGGVEALNRLPHPFT